MEQNLAGFQLAGPVADKELSRAQQLIATLQTKGVSLRLIGGIAIRLRCPGAKHPALDRPYSDIDFVGYKKQSRALRDIMETSGYTPDRRFNAIHGDRRLLFFDEARNSHVDVFLDVFEMCHTLSLDRKLELHPFTLSPADLLLTKLQIVQLNKKDIQDILAILLDFHPTEKPQHPGEDLDVHAIAALCTQDWGWFTTISDNLDRIAKEAGQILQPHEAELVVQRVDIIKTIITNAPKSPKWRLRALAGRRIPWYELPAEVNR